MIDSKAVLSKLRELLTAEEVEIFFNSPVNFIDVKARKVITPAGEFSYGYLFNCAGASADKVAKHYGLGLDYTPVPFKGTGGIYRCSPFRYLQAFTACRI